MAYGSFEADGITVSSSEHTDDQLAANLTAVVEPETPEIEAPEPVEVVDPPKPKPRNDPRARVEQATAKEAEAKRERDAVKAERDRLAAENLELKARVAPKPEPKVEPKPAATDPEPSVEQFDTYEKFVDAKARWAARQEWDSREQARQKHDVQQRHEHAQREIERTFGERWSKALADDPTLPDRVNPVLTTTLRVGALPEGQAATFDNFLVEQIFRSAHPKDLALHLSDPATYQRYATLHPIEVLGELAFFHRSLGAASPAAPAPKAIVSHAKPPIQPLGTSHIAADPDEISDDLSVDEHIARMNAKDRRARRAS